MGAYGCDVPHHALLATRGTVRPGRTDRAQSSALALSSMGACAVIALVDPGTAGRYPVCPTQALLGIDCPACGTLRGLHALSRGRVADALGHNVLLLVAVPIALLIWFRWARTAVGLPLRPLEMPRWVLPTTVVVAAIFTIVRNLPIQGLIWLSSG